MAAYLIEFMSLIQHFGKFELSRIPREKGMLMRYPISKYKDIGAI